MVKQPVFTGFILDGATNGTLTMKVGRQRTVNHIFVGRAVSR